jgi:hypothetical protein
MIAGLTPVALALIGIALLLVIGKVALAPANRLGLGVFRPWRGDPWPVGVQEDDDVRFAWSSRRPDAPGDDRPAPDDDPLAHIAYRPARNEPEAARVEDIGPQPIDVVRLERVDVHRARR